jgi:Tol biopolymer transport system component
MVQRADGKGSLWIYDAERGLGSQLVDDLEFPTACWSQDSRRITYARRAAKGYEAHVRSVDSAAEDVRVADGWISGWSSDGAWLGLNLQQPGTGVDVAIVRADGSEPPRVLVATAADEQGATFSPDGRWLLFGSTQSGRFELCVSPVAGPGPIRAVTSDGVWQQPTWQWLPDGRILYRNLSGSELYAVETKSHDGELELGPPRRLAPMRDFTFTRSICVTNDGARMLRIVAMDDRPTRLTLVRGWGRQ